MMFCIKVYISIESLCTCLKMMLIHQHNGVLSHAMFAIACCLKGVVTQ